MDLEGSYKKNWKHASEKLEKKTLSNQTGFGKFSSLKVQKFQ